MHKSKKVQYVLTEAKIKPKHSIVSKKFTIFQFLPDDNVANWWKTYHRLIQYIKKYYVLRCLRP